MKERITVKSINCDPMTDETIAKHMIETLSIKVRKELTPSTLRIKRVPSKEFNGFNNESEFIVFDSYGLESYTEEIKAAVTDKIIEEYDHIIRKLNRQKEYQNERIKTLENHKNTTLEFLFKEKFIEKPMIVVDTDAWYCKKDLESSIVGTNSIRLNLVEKDLKDLKKSLRGV